MGTEKKIDELLNSNYDGIQEYDNDLPRWWLYLFYITIVIALVYPLYYHFGPGLSQEQILAKDLVEDTARAQKLAQSEQVVTEEQLLGITKVASVLELGKQVFATRCAACHLAEGQGLVGPNLTDKYWIHGGKITDIHRIVENGVVEKGMLAWKTQLSKDELQAVVAFVWSIRGSNPPNAKAPQGDLVE